MKTTNRAEWEKLNPQYAIYCRDQIGGLILIGAIVLGALAAMVGTLTMLAGR